MVTIDMVCCLCNIVIIIVINVNWNFLVPDDFSFCPLTKIYIFTKSSSYLQASAHCPQDCGE